MRALIPQSGGFGLAGFLPGAAFSGVKDTSLVLLALARHPWGRRHLRHAGGGESRALEPYRIGFGLAHRRRNHRGSDSRGRSEV